MTPLASTLNSLISWGTLVLQIGIVLGGLSLLAVILKHPDQRLHRLSHKAADHAFLIGFLISLGAFITSMIYSNVIGYEPCSLCWWQRVFIYPQMFIFGIALYNEKVKKIQDEMVFLYSLVLSVIGAGIAAFNYYGQSFNPNILGTCAEGAVSCAKLYFVSFGYMTIPLMSLTAYILLILLFFFRRHRAK